MVKLEFLKIIMKFILQKKLSELPDTDVFIERVIIDKENIIYINEKIKELMGNNKNFNFLNSYTFKIVDTFNMYDLDSEIALREGFEISILGVKENIINNVRLYEIDPHDDSLELCNNFGDLKEKECIAFNIFYTCGIPQYVLKWDVNSTEEIFTFEEDGVDGSVNYSKKYIQKKWLKEIMEAL